MAIKKIFLIIILVCFWHPTSFAQDAKDTTVNKKKHNDQVLVSDPAWLRLKPGTKFLIHIDDSVKDGCWTNVKAVRNAIELELKRSKFKIEKPKEIAFVEIQVAGTGYKTNTGLCLSSYRLEVVIHEIRTAHKYFKLHYFQTHAIFTRGGVMSGPIGGFSVRLKEGYLSFMQEFLNQIDVEQAKVLEEIKKSSRTTNEFKTYWLGTFLSRLRP